jgi:hypothetical protein
VLAQNSLLQAGGALRISSLKKLVYFIRLDFTTIRSHNSTSTGIECVADEFTDSFMG